MIVSVMYCALFVKHAQKYVLRLVIGICSCFRKSPCLGFTCIGIIVSSSNYVCVPFYEFHHDLMLVWSGMCLLSNPILHCLMGGSSGGTNVWARLAITLLAIRLANYWKSNHPILNEAKLKRTTCTCTCNTIAPAPFHCHPRTVRAFVAWPMTAVYCLHQCLC